MRYIISSLVCSVVIVWSQILDGCKNYESEETPTRLSPASNTPKMDSPDLKDLNEPSENNSPDNNKV